MIFSNDRMDQNLVRLTQGQGCIVMPACAQAWKSRGGLKISQKVGEWKEG
jgi:hypothetical protein